MLSILHEGLLLYSKSVHLCRCFNWKNSIVYVYYYGYIYIAVKFLPYVSVLHKLHLLID